MADMFVPNSDYYTEVTSGKFITTETLPYPESFGNLTLLDPDKMLFATGPHWEDVEVWTNSGICTVWIGATVADLSLDKTDEFKPVRRAFQYRLVVDGEPWRWNPADPIRDLPLGGEWEISSVYGFCDAPAELCNWSGYDWESGVSTDQWKQQFFDSFDPGVETATTHTILMRAWLPGTDLVLETPAIEVDFQCPERIQTACLQVSDDISGEDAASLAEVVVEDIVSSDAAADSVTITDDDPTLEDSESTGCQMSAGRSMPLRTSLATVIFGMLCAITLLAARRRA